MALRRDLTYPNRYSSATQQQPQGAFLNRTTPTSNDGSYPEQQWLNDWSALFSSLLVNAGITPNNSVDNVGSCQYYDALNTVIALAKPNNNLFINGDFSVCQRYPTNTPTNINMNSFYFADRWLCNASNSTEPKTTVEVVNSPDQYNGEPYLYFQTHTADDNTSIHQRIENVQLMVGQTMTLSIEMNNSQVCNMTTKIYCANQGIKVSDSSWDNVPSSTWVKKTVTFTVPASWGEIGADYIDVSIGCSDNISGTWRYRRAKLEIGEVATTFIPEDPATNLMKCQRYYYGMSAENFGIGMAYADSSSGFTSPMYFPVTMRTSPAVSVSCDTPKVRNTTSAVAFTGRISASAYNESTACISLSGGNLSAGIVSFLGGNTVISFDAEF